MLKMICWQREPVAVPSVCAFAAAIKNISCALYAAMAVRGRPLPERVLMTHILRPTPWQRQTPGVLVAVNQDNPTKRSAYTKQAKSSECHIMVLTATPYNFSRLQQDAFAGEHQALGRVVKPCVRNCVMVKWVLYLTYQ